LERGEGKNKFSSKLATTRGGETSWVDVRVSEGRELEEARLGIPEKQGAA